MGAPDKGMQAAEQPAAETLLTALKTIDAAERRKHASVLNYWLSIRGTKELPPLHDFDPLEISDFGQSSMLAELIGSGHDADIRHLGDALKADGAFERIVDAPTPSILSSIARKLPIVTISRDFLAFEDQFTTANGPTRCWVTLLPLSSSGAWVDYVYAFVSVEPAIATAVAEEVANEVESVSADAATPNEVEAPVDSVEAPVDAVEAIVEQAPAEPAPAPAAGSAPGFAKLLEGFAGLAGFYGQGVKPRSVVDYEPPASDAPAAEAAEPEAIEQVADEPEDDKTQADEPEAIEAEAAEPEAVEPEAVEAEAVEAETVEPEAVEPEAVEAETVEPEAVDPEAVEQTVEEPAAVEPEAVDEPAAEPAQETIPAVEGQLQDKLADVRAKADEARAAKLRANLALYEGLGAAHDFALDAEDSPEEYLRLVEARGLKIQLRAPMAPVVRLVFDGLCDDGVIAQLEAVLAWALKEELPRGTLAARIEEAGGIAGILGGAAQPA